MNRHILFLIFIASLYKATSQNVKIAGVKKIYYYKTSENFFNDKVDSIVGDEMVYDYGKVSYIDKATNKKVKYHLHKDLSIFAFKIFWGTNNITPLFAVNNSEKRYGVYMGGSKNLFLVFYSRGNIDFTSYDAQNYVVAYSGTIDEFGYYLEFTKKDVQAKKNGDIEYFIKDLPQLYKKYTDEKANATTYYWNKNYVMKQLEYLQAYNANFQ